MILDSTLLWIMAKAQDLPVVPLPDKTDSGKKAFEALKGLSFDDAITKIANGTVNFIFKLLIAAVVFYVGKFIIRKLYSITRDVLLRRKVDASLTTFVLSLIKMVLLFILIITVIGIIGIETSSFLALFASAGVAIGMALSGTLQNFAGGVLILLLKPYKVGDFVETQGYTGTVRAIQIFHTVLNTTDNKAIIIPNGGLSTGSIKNYSLERYRRVDWTIALAYGTDYAAAREAILKIVESDPRVITPVAGGSNTTEATADAAAQAVQVQEEIESAAKKRGLARFFNRRKIEQKSLPVGTELNPVNGLPETVTAPPFVGLNELADSSINIVVRAWTRAEDYWGLFFELNSRFYTELPQAGFSFPFPQLDVHLETMPTSK